MKDRLMQGAGGRGTKLKPAGGFMTRKMRI